MFPTKYLSVLKTAWIPQRYVLVIMGMLALVNCFTMRACLSVAINEMAPPPPAQVSTDGVCPFDEATSSMGNSSNSSSNAKKYPFDWSQADIGLILGSFYIGYIFTHIPGGQIADRYGGKHTLGLGVLATVICTFLTPWITNIAGVGGAIGVRILMGLGEGVTFPAIYVLLAKWAPEQERSLMGTIVLAGPQVGTLVGNVLSGWLLKWFDWVTTFYVYGTLGFMWYVLWSFLCYSEPKNHPFISDKELDYLTENVKGAKEQEKESKHVKTPWFNMLTSIPVLALIITEVGHDWGFYTMVTDLPKYMSDVQHFNIASSGLLAALPFLCMWISSMVLSYVGDWIVMKNIMSNTNMRKMFTTIGSVGPGVFLLWASYAGCDHIVVEALFCVGMACMGAFYPGMRVNALDLSPRHAGTIGALMNGVGALAGVGAPFAIGQIANNGLMSEWQIVFGINLAIMSITNLAFLFFGSGEVQWWDDPNTTRPGDSEAPADVFHHPHPKSEKGSGSVQASTAM